MIRPNNFRFKIKIYDIVLVSHDKMFRFNSYHHKRLYIATEVFYINVQSIIYTSYIHFEITKMWSPKEVILITHIFTHYYH